MCQLLLGLANGTSVHEHHIAWRQVQSGVGRTGKWWAHQHFKGVVPDIMLFAKGIASGFPFAGIAAKPEMYQGLPTGSLVGFAIRLV